MSSPEETITSLASKVNQLRGLYGFDTVKYFTFPSREDVFLRLSNPESSDCGVTAHVALKDGCFGIRSCPVFHNRVDLLGRRGSKADLLSQVIKWFQDNKAKLPLSYKEEKIYINLKAKIQSSEFQDQQFAEEFEAFISSEAKIRGHLVSKDRVGVVVSGKTLESAISNDIAQLGTTDENNGRGIKRAREEDTDMPGGDVEVPRKLSKQGIKRAARRAKVMAIMADAEE
ncbi:uncharacterized protein EAF01_002283 [Botrytis porri]|uniref:Uncharacterized protein n=1 Tax=Botrytis porri TaxID=87229 RepID=A0A4Z1KLX0_9HELO|nr:uncharacterized protein EAF01_002283 [Botrytis porri]KAF7910774.1 hypothetical protein EAF01_002283 [Botrytis porri]TGO87061.1 hypothetical protein BPOR_0253g00020 [Botrytis porri]